MFIKFHETMAARRAGRKQSVRSVVPKQWKIQPEYEYLNYDGWERLYLIIYAEVSKVLQWSGIYEGQTKTFDRRKMFYYVLAIVALAMVILPPVVASIVYVGRSL